MAEISGVPTADIDNVDGFFTTSGGGGTASLSPTFSIAGTPFGATLTITNFASYSNPNWEVSVFVGATEIVTNAQVQRELDGNLMSDFLSWSDTSPLTGARTVKVRAQTFGDFVQSVEVTGTYSKAVVNYQFLRIQGVDSSGVSTSQRLAMRHVRFYSGASQTGTRYAAGNMTGNTTPSGENLSLSQGYVYSTTYDAYRAMDGSNNFSWLIGANASQNWWQCEFTGTVPIIQSLEIFMTNNADASYIKLLGSNTGAFTGEEVNLGVFLVPNNNTTTYIG